MFEYYFIKRLCTHLEKEEAFLNSLPIKSLVKSSKHACKLAIGVSMLGQRKTLLPRLEQNISPVLVNGLHYVKDLTVMLLFEEI